MKKEEEKIQSWSARNNVARKLWKGGLLMAIVFVCKDEVAASSYKKPYLKRLLVISMK